MKIYRIWSLEMYAYLILSVGFFILAFIGNYANNRDFLIILIIGILCFLYAIFNKYFFYSFIEDGKFIKVSFSFLRREVDISKIKKLEFVYFVYGGYHLFFRDDSEYQMHMLKLSNMFYHSKTLSEIIKDLKKINKNIELDDIASDLLMNGKLNVVKLQAWQYWS